MGERLCRARAHFITIFPASQEPWETAAPSYLRSVEFLMETHRWILTGKQIRLLSTAFACFFFIAAFCAN